MLEGPWLLPLLYRWVGARGGDAAFCMVCTVLKALPVWWEQCSAGAQIFAESQVRPHCWLAVQPSCGSHDLDNLLTSFPRALACVCATRLTTSSVLHGPHPTRCPRHCGQPICSSTTLPAPTATTLNTSPLSPISCSCLQQHL